MSQDPRARFARYLTRAMVAADIKNKSELARRLNADPSVVGRWLRAETDITVAYIRELAPVIRVNPLELMIQAGMFSRAEIQDAARRMVESERSPA